MRVIALTKLAKSIITEVPDAVEQHAGQDPRIALNSC